MKPTAMDHSTSWVWIVLLAVGAGSAAPSDDDPGAPSRSGVSEPDAAEARTVETTQITPRLELDIPSISSLVSEAHRSRCGVLIEHARSMLLEMGSDAAEGVDVEGVAALIAEARDWPDTSIHLEIYAPDEEGRPRWALRLEWPLKALAARVTALLGSDAGETLFESVRMARSADGDYEIALPESTLCHLTSQGPNRSAIVSHANLTSPIAPLASWSQDGDEAGSLLVCRLNFGQTEPDSGATFFSSFRAASALDYACRVTDDGGWKETVRLHWPPISGMGAKLLFNKVKKTYFVPAEAFVAIVGGSTFLPEMLDDFGPQMMMEDSGDFAMVGEPEPGPLGSHVSSEACLVVLPGTGLIPIPDIVVQARVKSSERLLDDVREAAEWTNDEFRRRDQIEPWHEVSVYDRTVFWREPTGPSGGMLMPAVLRTVLFTTRETDPKGKQRDFVVVAWTSTSPERLVRRWLDLPRGEKGRFLPSARKTYGQVWTNWKQIYKWVHPYLNLGLSFVARDALLPTCEEMSDHLTDGELTLKLRYTGLHVYHRGPLPIGVVVVPAMLAEAGGIDESGGSDLAREQLACRRLRVLYHHCKLFKKDYDRWPAELAELDGYIDFDGHPELLKLELSSKKKWSDRIKSMFVGTEEDEQEEDEEDGWIDIDDKLYVIKWGRDRWTLGLAAETLEHLEKLYIDQDGEIHRVVKQQEPAPAEIGALFESSWREKGSKVLHTAATNISRRYFWKE